MNPQDVVFLFLFLKFKVQRICTLLIGLPSTLFLRNQYDSDPANRYSFDPATKAAIHYPVQIQSVPAQCRRLEPQQNQY